MKTGKTMDPGDLAGPCLIFRLGDKRYGAPAKWVLETVRLPEVSPVDDAADHFVGVINLRGRAVPVMDLSLRMGRQSFPYQVSDALVVLENPDGGCLGLVVNDVVEIRDFSPEDIGLLPDMTDPDPRRRAKDRRFIIGMAKTSQELIRVLDVPALFGDPSEACPELPEDEEETAPLQPQTRFFSPDMSEKQAAVFRDRAKKLMKPLEHETFQSGEALAVVTLGGELLGVDLSMVRGFSGVKHITPIPCCPNHILGDINLRGEILTVVDLRGFLNLKKKTGASGGQVMVVNINHIRAGIHIDDVLDVIHLDASRIASPPVAGTALKKEYLTGAVPLGKGILSIIDLKGLFGDERLRVTEEA